jgi:hypothetical protein
MQWTSVSSRSNTIVFWIQGLLYGGKTTRFPIISSAWGDRRWNFTYWRDCKVYIRCILWVSDWRNSMISSEDCCTVVIKFLSYLSASSVMWSSLYLSSRSHCNSEGVTDISDMEVLLWFVIALSYTAGLLALLCYREISYCYGTYVMREAIFYWGS